MRLEGKAAIITGAANGIGAAAARRFVAEGARVLLVDRDAAALQTLASELGDRAATFAGDVTLDDTADGYVQEAVRRFGRVDAALLNAGIEGTIGPIEQQPVSMFDQVMAVNVRGVWLGLVALFPAMRAQGGSIVITSSTAGLRGSPHLAAYSASKHAVIGLMRSAAQEGAAHKIRVNTVNPGPTKTRMIEALDASKPAGADRATRMKRIPLQRYGEVAETVNVMLFLASDDSSYCTGATYLVDGGLLSGSN